SALNSVCSVYSVVQFSSLRWRGGGARTALVCFVYFVFLAGVAQARRDAVDGQVHALQHRLVGVAATAAAAQLDLQVVQGIDVGQPRTDQRRQVRVLVEQRRLAGDPEQRFGGALPLGADLAEHVLGQRAVLDQRRVASGDRQVGLGQHH